MSAVNDNVIRLYQVRPEMALEHLKRATGLNFDEMPESLVTLANAEEQKLNSKLGSVSTLKNENERNKSNIWSYEEELQDPPILSDVIGDPVFKKSR